MDSSLERLENSRAKLVVEVTEPEVKRAYTQAYQQIVRRVNIPGFRKGKAPLHVLEKRFGPEVLYEEAVNNLVKKAYLAALKEHKLIPVADPEVDTQDEFKLGQGFKFTVTVDVFPEVKLGEYKGLTAEKPDTTVTEAMLEQALAEVRERHAELVPVEDREIIAKGDFVRIDFIGFLEGEPFPGGAVNGYFLEVGSGQFVPGFEEQLVGLKLNEEQTIKVTFPEDYQAKHLAGKEVEFKVTPKAIQKRVYPELNDEFVRDISEYQTLAEYQESIKGRLAHELEQRAMQEVERQLVEKAVANAEVDLPLSVVKQETDRNKQLFLQHLGYRGLTLEQYLEETKQTEADIDKQAEEQAKNELKQTYVLDAIAEAEGLAPDENEIKERAEQLYLFRTRYSRRRGPQKDSSEYRGEAAAQLRLSAARQFLVDNAQITPVTKEGEGKEEK